MNRYQECGVIIETFSNICGYKKQQGREFYNRTGALNLTELLLWSKRSSLISWVKGVAYLIEKANRKILMEIYLRVLEECKVGPSALIPENIHIQENIFSVFAEATFKIHIMD